MWVKNTKKYITGTLIYLVSSASDYLSGRVFFLDGGWMAS
jgi:hypothetical protein